MMDAALRYSTHWIDFGAAGQKMVTVGFDCDGSVCSAAVRIGGILLDVVGDLSPKEIEALQEEQAGRDNDPNNYTDFLYEERRAAQ